MMILDEISQSNFEVMEENSVKDKTINPLITPAVRRIACENNVSSYQVYIHIMNNGLYRQIQPVLKALEKMEEY